MSFLRFLLLPLQSDFDLHLFGGKYRTLQLEVPEPGFSVHQRRCFLPSQVLEVFFGRVAILATSEAVFRAKEVKSLAKRKNLTDHSNKR